MVSTRGIGNTRQLIYLHHFVDTPFNYTKIDPRGSVLTNLRSLGRGKAGGGGGVQILKYQIHEN